MGNCLFMRKGEVHTAPVNGILASDLAVGSSVYLLENGSPVEYLVVNQGIPSQSSLYDSSCDGLWLLRKNIYSEQAWWSTPPSSNDYSTSSIHQYLNGDFFSTLDNTTKESILQVKLPYCKGKSDNFAECHGSNGISTKIFLLGAYELGSTVDLYPIVVDGALLDYFVVAKRSTKRIAYYNGTATTWWLRTPVTGEGNSLVSMAVSNGDIGNMGSSASYGIRPALILPFNAVFDKKTRIFKEVT